MRIAVAADHAGFELKEHVRAYLEGQGHEVTDFGTTSLESVDYPLFAGPAARSVAAGEHERGVFVCGSGNGIMLAANKVHGVRAVNAHDPLEAGMARHHNDINVLTMSGWRVGFGFSDEIVEAFLHTEFDGGRHERRVGEISDLEQTG